MEAHTILKAHSGIVQLFLIFIIFKVVLLFVNKPLLSKVRAKTKIVDMVLGLFILISGFLAFDAIEWMIMPMLIVKILMALASIPLAIVAFKKENKMLAVLSIALMIATYAIGYMLVNGKL